MRVGVRGGGRTRGRNAVQEEREWGERKNGNREGKGVGIERSKEAGMNGEQRETGKLKGLCEKKAQGRWAKK